MRRVVVLMVGLTLAFAATGCMWGIARDATTGAPVTGATVSYTDSLGRSASTTTDANGLYSFDWSSDPIPALGPISVNVSAPGYQTLMESRQVAYNDNPNATTSNPSSYWEVQHFFLAHGGGPPPPPPPPSGADITPTDLYPDNPQGDMWVRITNNGPDTLVNKKVSITLSGSTFSLTVPPQEWIQTPLTHDYILNLAPGQTQPINLKAVIDISTFRYDFTVTVAAVDFTDPNTGNNTYKESVGPVMASLILTNASGGWIGDIRFRVSGQPSWGDNRLPTNPADYVVPGETATWQIPAGSYDLRAYIGDQVLDERLNVGISGTYDWTVQAALDIHNSASFTIQEVYIVPAGAPDWGPNLLGPGETIPQYAVRRWRLGPGGYDLHVRGVLGQSPTLYHRTLWAANVGGVCAWFIQDQGEPGLSCQS